MWELRCKMSRPVASLWQTEPNFLPWAMAWYGMRHHVPKAVRCAIQDFKWGDYSVEPNTTLRPRWSDRSGAGPRGAITLLNVIDRYWTMSLYVTIVYYDKYCYTMSRYVPEMSKVQLHAVRHLRKCGSWCPGSWARRPGWLHWCSLRSGEGNSFFVAIFLSFCPGKCIPWQAQQLRGQACMWEQRPANHKISLITPFEQVSCSCSHLSWKLALAMVGDSRSFGLAWVRQEHHGTPRANHVSYNRKPPSSLRVFSSFLPVHRVPPHRLFSCCFSCFTCIACSSCR